MEIGRRDWYNTMVKEIDCPMEGMDMKTPVKYGWPGLVTLLCGMMGLYLRRQLYLTAVDEKNLLLRHTPLELGLLVLSAGFLLFLMLIIRKTSDCARYEDHYRSGILSALGHWALAAGIWYTVRSGGLPAGGYLGNAWYWLGQAAPVCLLLAGGARLLGKRPFFLLHVVLCLFLLVHIVGNYQLWSSNPQLQDHLFSLLSIADLALLAYYTAAFETDRGDCRMVRLTGLAGVFLCLTELGRTSQPLLYAGGALWALTILCSPEPVVREME